MATTTHGSPGRPTPRLQTPNWWAGAWIWVVAALIAVIIVGAVALF